MRAVRSWLIACAIVAFAVPAFAQEKKADPHAKPATPEKKAEPAKPAAQPEKKAEPAKPAAQPEVKKVEPAAKPADKPAAAAGAEIGKPAPDFALKDVNGKDVKLADFKGKIVVLEWSNPACPFCQRHAKNKTAEKTLANFKDKPVAWVNIDSTATAKADDIKAFIKDNGLTAPYLMDSNGATGKAYGAKTTPHVFVIDAKGNLAYSGAMDDDADGKKEKAKNYVQEAIDALVKGSAVATATSTPYGCPVKY